MKIKNFLPVMAMTLVVAVALLFTSAKEAEFKDYDWLKPRLDAAKDYTIEVLEAMPADEYDFKASEEQRTFGAQAYHIVYSVDYFERAFANGGNADWKPGEEDSKSKEELIKWANAKFDSMHGWIMEQSADDRLTAGIVSYLDHNAHHRGQVITYLRMNDITPPSYR